MCKIVSSLQVFKKAAVEKQVSKSAGTLPERRNRILQIMRCPAYFPGSSGVFHLDWSSDSNRFFELWKEESKKKEDCLHVSFLLMEQVFPFLSIYQGFVHRNNHLTGLNMSSIWFWTQWGTVHGKGFPCFCIVEQCCFCQQGWKKWHS